MHSGFEIPGIQQHLQQSAPENNLLSMNQTHITHDHQIHHHSLPTPTQQLFLDHQHHFLPPHHYGGAAASSQAYFPVNFKLGLNEFCSRSNDYRDCSSSINNNNNNNNNNERGGGAAADGSFLRGSEQYELPEESTRHPSLGILHCWQNQQDSPIKQPRFWEPVAAEASNENSEIVERQEHLQMHHQKDIISKSRSVHFGELEAIYNSTPTSNNINNNQANQTGPSPSHSHIPPPVTAHLPLSEEEAGSDSLKNNNADKKPKNRKKKKKTETSYMYSELVDPMSEFFENFTKQVMDHQESLHRKFSEAVERLDEERRAREEAWRNQELAHFEEESLARARDRASAKSREAMIVSYLEKITGQRIDFPSEIERGSLNISSHDFQKNGEMHEEGVN
ncbi:hypothetical protein ABFS82_01G008000 [Erythranthe guttata]|nr:PREDICTED: trihelix transcription factor GTL1-like [Erythranthe guttata]|eukprot:XP_012857893.1 PREDICTED: trihelix transcription factor GTL1-like [Erythranthe guttata]